jgi:hypothetical protein
MVFFACKGRGIAHVDTWIDLQAEGLKLIGRQRCFLKYNENAQENEVFMDTLRCYGQLP